MKAFVLCLPKRATTSKPLRCLYSNVAHLLCTKCRLHAINVSAWRPSGVVRFSGTWPSARRHRSLNDSRVGPAAKACRSMGAAERYTWPAFSKPFEHSTTLPRRRNEAGTDADVVSVRCSRSHRGHRSREREREGSGQLSGRNRSRGMIDHHRSGEREGVDAHPGGREWDREKERDSQNTSQSSQRRHSKGTIARNQDVFIIRLYI